MRNGVPRLLPRELPDSVVQTAAAFGWQWHAFSDQLTAFHEEFLEWLAPVRPNHFRDKRVLDAGCGKGRHLLLAAEFGAREVVGLDLSTAVDVARQSTADLPAVDIVQGDLLAPPLREGSFDLVYSIGVIHHVPDPSAAVRALAKCLRPGGVLHVWVYGYEGNSLVRWLVDPLRRHLATRVPRSAVRVATLPLGLVLSLLARVSPRLQVIPGLPYRQYLQSLSGYSVRHIWTIVYDQLMAPTTHYVRRGELRAWFHTAGLTNVHVRASRGMSWAASGERP